MATTPQTDLFQEPHVSIPKNQTLATEVNRLLSEIQRNPKLMDGDEMGEIDLALWFTGLRLENYFTPEQIKQFKLCVQKAPAFETTSRARRYILERDLGRVSQKAVKRAAQFEARIIQGFKK